jgi:hypothetical protein
MIREVIELVVQGIEGLAAQSKHRVSTGRNRLMSEKCRVTSDKNESDK